MSLEAKTSDPISININESGNITLSNDLVLGLAIGGNHYGFSLIIELNDVKRKVVYQTKRKINIISFEDEILSVYEEDMKTSWHLNLASESWKEFLLNPPIFKNPVSVKMARNPAKNVVLNDSHLKKDYPLYPGVMFGTENYGCILISGTDEDQKEAIYPTQNRIVGVGADSPGYGDIHFYEEDQRSPWIFSYDGRLKSFPLSNPYAKTKKVLTFKR